MEFTCCGNLIRHILPSVEFSVIYKHKTDLMRELVRLVSHGYQQWTAGSVEAKKLEALQLKFGDRTSMIMPYLPQDKNPVDRE